MQKTFPRVNLAGNLAEVQVESGRSGQPQVPPGVVADAEIARVTYAISYLHQLN